MTTQSLPPEVQQLLDRQQIYDCIVRYCSGVDRFECRRVAHSDVRALGRRAWRAVAVRPDRRPLGHVAAELGGLSGLGDAQRRRSRLLPFRHGARRCAAAKAACSRAKAPARRSAPHAADAAEEPDAAPAHPAPGSSGSHRGSTPPPAWLGRRAVRSRRVRPSPGRLQPVSPPATTATRVASRFWRRSISTTRSSG